MEDEGYSPLFETKQGRRRLIHRTSASSILIAICFVLVYRATHIPKSGEEGRWGWIALFLSEIWFSFYWLLTQVVRWNCVYRTTFKDRLSKKYEDVLPKVDIFVCTADPVIEPPMMVINTILSVMAYDYPTDKLSVYLSDDGCSILTFHALFEASHFSKAWLPYCRKYTVEPRSPAAYFISMPKPTNPRHSRDLDSIQILYETMHRKIETSTALGRVPEEIQDMHKGFSKWNDRDSYISKQDHDTDSYISKQDHDTILQILIDGSNISVKDDEGYQLPTLVYVAREKRPHHFLNFKAGAMNALLRVSAEISNASIILNVDCDMYSNNSGSIRDALCFFMDEVKSQEIAFVQFPQIFENIEKNDTYGACLKIIMEVEFAGLDGVGGPLYIGTGCFHRRDILLGLKYSKQDKIDWRTQTAVESKGTLHELEEKTIKLASSTYELNSQWGKEVGLKYGCPIEDVLTGLSIQCRGWKSVYLHPERSSFLGLAAITLNDTLIQHKRWSEGQLQIMLEYCPLWYGRNKISLSLQLGYLNPNLWAINSIPTICYCTISSLYMLSNNSLFPEVSNIWFWPFTYILIANYTYSLSEFLCSKGTLLQWWNEQRIWLYKRTSSYLFAFIEIFLKFFGFTNMKFVITNKCIDEDVQQRYVKGIMEFGVRSPMFTILTTIALMNLLALVVFLIQLLVGENRTLLIQRFTFQFILCGVLTLINYPLFEATFIRKDKGKMPRSVATEATLLALLTCGLYFLVRF